MSTFIIINVSEVLMGWDPFPRNNNFQTSTFIIINVSEVLMGWDPFPRNNNFQTN